MKIFMSKILAFIVLILLISGHANSWSAEDSYIAIGTDNKTCQASEGKFLPLPEIGSPEANFKFIDSRIDEIFGKDCKLTGLLLSGNISNQTLKQLRLGLELLKARKEGQGMIGNVLWLNSPGGLILEAMKIGDVIAENEMSSIVTINGRCYSACVFVFAAAKTRSPIGDVGIHRPFGSEISVESLSYPEYLKKYETLTPVMKQYFSKYGVSPALVDAMNVVPSDNIKILSKHEMESFGLGFSNVAAKEFTKASTIQKCGQNYYELQLKFYAHIEECKKRVGAEYYSGKGQECWDLAHQAFPSYSEQFDICKTKLSK